jgi:uncharacterized membrane protein
VSDLIAVAYDDRETVEHVRWELVTLTRERVLALDDVAIVTREPGGGIKLRPSLDRGGGGLSGDLIGMLLLGSLEGDEFMDELAASLTAGGAALIVLVRSRSPEKVLPQMSQNGGKLIRTSLSPEAEARLDAVLTASA